MTPVVRVSGRMLPLRRDDVDTDQIVPASFLTRTSRTGYADALFASWRDQPGFPLLSPRYQGATILVAGADFGSGSSREHAVWALKDFGFVAVVSSRFPDIFRRNALRNGLVPVQVTPEWAAVLLDLAEQSPRTVLRVDVANAVLTWAGGRCHVQLSTSERERLLSGRDDVEVTLQRTDAIAAYEASRPTWLPKTC